MEEEILVKFHVHEPWSCKRKLPPSTDQEARTGREPMAFRSSMYHNITTISCVQRNRGRGLLPRSVRPVPKKFFQVDVLFMRRQQLHKFFAWRCCFFADRDYLCFCVDVLFLYTRHWTHFLRGLLLDCLVPELVPEKLARLRPWYVAEECLCMRVRWACRGPFVFFWGFWEELLGQNVFTIKDL